MLPKKHFHIAKIFSAVALLFLLGTAAHATQKNNTYKAYETYNRNVLKASVQSHLGEPQEEGLHNIDAIKGIYTARDNKPFWLTKFSREDLYAVVTVFRDSWTHGLNPDNYYTEQIAGLLDKMHSNAHAKKARLEVMLSAAALRYAQDMTGMRVLTQNLFDKEAYWRDPLEAADVFKALESAESPATVLTAYAPESKYYKTMRSELIKLAGELSKQKTTKEPIKFDRPYFFPGDAHGDVVKLRERLNVSYDPSVQQGYKSPRIYDDKLSAAVVQFQKENRLTADGILGPNTVRALNFTTQDKVDQLIANMERARWMSVSLPSKYIFVNIPSQKLWAIDEGAVKHQMNVVVGHPTRRTKIFKANVEGVRFNPKWNVPLSIKMRDFLPKLKEDPYALTEKGIEFMRGYGRNAVTLDPGTIDWANVGWRKMGKIRMVQTPGDHNALGRIRILMPNVYNIYLHDTNHKELFAQESRALSSGCIRLEAPHKMASFVLKEKAGWNDKNMDELLSGLETEEVYIDESIPVYVAYQSIWLDSNDGLVYGPDIYNRDRKMVQALKNLNAYYIPPYNNNDSATASTDLASAHVMP